MRRAVLCCVALWVVCAWRPAAAFPFRRDALISVATEVEIGREAQKQMRASTPRVTGVVAAYVANVGRQLAAHAGGPAYPYSFSVANSRDINAFALPGGAVWVNRGAIQAARNEAQLAGVLAHEIAHVAQRHAARQISDGMIADGLLGLFGAVLGNTGGARTAQAGAQILAGGYMLTFSRDDEREADRVGVEIMRRAGWDPTGMLEFMQILGARQGRDASSVDVFLSTHPSSAERIEHLRSQLTHAPRHGKRDSPDFQRTRAALVRIPARPKPARDPSARAR